MIRPNIAPLLYVTHKYRAPKNFNFFIFEFFQKILSWGRSVHSPLPTKQPGSKIGQAILETIGKEPQDSPSPWTHTGAFGSDKFC